MPAYTTYYCLTFSLDNIQRDPTLMYLLEVVLLTSTSVVELVELVASSCTINSRANIENYIV